MRCANCGELLPADGGSVLTCSACGLRHRSVSPPAEARNAVFQVGDRVAVLRGGHWWSAHVVEILSQRTRRVHYEGWAPSFDNEVDCGDIRPLAYEPGPSIIPPTIDESKLKIKRGGVFSAVSIVLILAAGGAALVFWAQGGQNNRSSEPSEVQAANMGGIFDRVPGTALRPDAQIQKDGMYFVKWGDGWYRGKVIEIVSPDRFVVQYDGWSIDYNESVSRSRLRSVE